MADYSPNSHDQLGRTDQSDKASGCACYGLPPPTAGGIVKRTSSGTSAKDGLKAFKMFTPFDVAIPIPQLSSGKQSCVERETCIIYVIKGSFFFKKWLSSWSEGWYPR